jgi:iron complex transport system ATP-binding protein
MGETASAMVLELEAVTFRRDGNPILRGVDWRVGDGEHWAVVGPNGAGKTTLLRIVAARMHPTSGTVRILGGQLGRVPVARLHERIALVDPRLARAFHPRAPVGEVVLTGTAGTIALLEDRVDPARADELIALLGISQVTDRAFGEASEGERTRTLLARALMLDPALLLLDEPTAGLDLPGRETVLTAIQRVTDAHPALASVTVTHHLEELAPSTSHALLLRDGAVVAAGPVAAVLTDELLTACLGIAVHVERTHGHFRALPVRGGAIPSDRR